MMDPRNSINNSDVFQFLQLSSSSQDYTNNQTVRNVLKSMANGIKYMDEECINAILKAATDYHVDPYYIMAKIVGEQGGAEKPTVSALVSGNGYNGNYVRIL